MLSPIAWRTPPRHYGPWENVVSLLTEGLVARGMNVTLFATGDSQTKGHLKSVCPMGYEEEPSFLPKVWECLHISEVFEQGERLTDSQPLRLPAIDLHGYDHNTGGDHHPWVLVAKNFTGI
jgi:hypothetical protein